MKKLVYRRLVELSNGKFSSKVLKRISTAKLSKTLIPSYIKVFKIDTQEISRDIKDFKNLHQFFIRPLKEDVRPIEEGENCVISPVDARIESFGSITPHLLFEVKGKKYSLYDLLGNEDVASKYRGGQFIVFYLSPANYHRLHSPINGSVIKQYVLGQKSYPVNRLGLKYGKKPLSHNYRMITELIANNIHFSFIKVGAMFVNSIELTNTSKFWKKGEEIGYFSFGSTVVMLFEKDKVQFTNKVAQGVPIKVGEAFATMV